MSRPRDKVLYYCQMNVNFNYNVVYCSQIRRNMSRFIGSLISFECDIHFHEIDK